MLFFKKGKNSKEHKSRKRKEGFKRGRLRALANFVFCYFFILLKTIKFKNFCSKLLKLWKKS